MISDFPLKNDIDLKSLEYEDLQTKDIPMLFCKNTFNTSVYAESQTLMNIGETIKEPIVVSDKEDNEISSNPLHESKLSASPKRVSGFLSLSGRYM